jgi:tetratricopeptide (TPR) repeat protein
MMRSRNKTSYRGARRPVSCASLLFLVGIVAGAASVTWLWLARHGTISPDGASAAEQLSLAQAAFLRGDLSLALALASTITAGPEKSPDLYGPAVLLNTRVYLYRSLSDYNRDGDLRAAVALTTRAMQIMPDDPQVQAAHGFALAASGRTASAGDAARAVLDVLPGHGPAQTALAFAYSQAGGHDRALREAGQAVALSDYGFERADALRILAAAYNATGDYPAAVAAIDEAIALADRLVPLYFDRARYALQTGDADAATVAYFQILTLDERNVLARLKLCELSTTLREHDTALDYCGQVTRMAPGWSDGWYRLGREYFLNGEFAQAQAHFNRCATLQVVQDVPVPERRFECWYLQGQAAQILGDCPALLAAWQEYSLMTADQPVTETWTYPPEGPLGCPAPQTGR